MNAVPTLTPGGPSGDSGAVLAFGSDSPVEAYPPLEGLHAAVTRRSPDGAPGPDGWHPEQRLGRLEALHGFTTGAAVASGEANRKGTLAPGCLADLVVLEEDLFLADAQSIPGSPSGAS